MMVLQLARPDIIMVHAYVGICMLFKQKMRLCLKHCIRTSLATYRSASRMAMCTVCVVLLAFVLYYWLFSLSTVSSLVEEGGDWDRRNRLKVYRALYAMQIRDFKTAAVNFFEAISTFTSTELMTYKTFVKYAALCCTVALPRSDLKSKVCLFHFKYVCIPPGKVIYFFLKYTLPCMD